MRKRRGAGQILLGGRTAGRAAVCGCAVILCVGSLALAAGPRGSSATGSAAATPARPQGEPEGLHLTLTVGGFELAEVGRAAGKFSLTVDNRSGVEQLTLRLVREGGELVRDIEVPKDAVDWAEEIELPAGKYVLSVSDRPDWACRITIQ